MLLLNDQERYSVYVCAKIVIYFDCTIFFGGFFYWRVRFNKLCRRIFMNVVFILPIRDKE